MRVQGGVRVSAHASYRTVGVWNDQGTLTTPKKGASSHAAVRQSY